MFNNQRYKFSQTEEEQSEVLDPAQQNEIEFREFINKLRYYRLGDYTDDREIKLARILYPYYKQNSEHENLTYIGFAIIAFPAKLPETSVVNFYSYIKRFSTNDLKEDLFRYSLSLIYPYIENGKINLDNLNSRLQRVLLTRFQIFFTDDKIDLISQLLTLPINIITGIIATNPNLLERFLLFNQKFPEYTEKAALNQNAFANYFELFFNHPNLINNFDVINEIFKLNGENTPIKYMVKWGESINFDDLSPDELNNFISTIKLKYSESIEISPDEIKEIIKNPKLFDYLNDTADVHFETLDIIYFIKKILQENFGEFVRKISLDINPEKYNSPESKKIQKRKAVYNFTLDSLPFDFYKNDAYFKSTQLMWLSHIPRKSLENLSKYKKDYGFCAYMDKNSTNGKLTDFEHKYLGLLSYKILRDTIKANPLITDENLEETLENNFKEENTGSNIPNEAYLPQMREYVKLSGLEITDPKIIKYYYYNKLSFADIDVEEYFEAMDQLEKMYPYENFSKNEYYDTTTEYNVFPYLIRIFGNNIPHSLIEAFDRDTLAWDFYEIKTSIAATESKYIRIFRNFLNKNKNNISYFELNRLIHNVQKLKLLFLNHIISEDEIDDISPRKLLFALESFPNASKEYVDKTFNSFANIYRTVDQNTELFRKMMLLLSKNPFAMGSSPKAFEYVFNLLPNFSNENMKNAAKIIAMFNKKSELWIKKHDNIHDAAQVIPNLISEKLKTKGSDFALRSNLSSAHLSTVLQAFDSVTDEDLLLPENELYNKIFISNVKSNIGDTEVKSDDFLIEFSSHGLDVNTFNIENVPDEYFDYYAHEDEDEEALEIEKINYSKLESLFIRSFDIPLPEWARDARFSAIYNNKELVGYFLPRNDTRGIFLGKYTGCCQHPTGEAWTSSLAGQLSENACFFVVENPKNKEIVCQSFTWQDFGTDGSYSSGDEKVVFDNVEAVGIGNRMDAVVEIYKKAAEHIASFGFMVILGEGASDIDLNRFGTSYQGSIEPNNLKEDFQHLISINEDIYSDAHNARILAEPEEKEEE